MVVIETGFASVDISCVKVYAVPLFCQIASSSTPSTVISASCANEPR